MPGSQAKQKPSPTHSGSVVRLFFFLPLFKGMRLFPSGMRQLFPSTIFGNEGVEERRRRVQEGTGLLCQRCSNIQHITVCSTKKGEALENECLGIDEPEFMVT